MRLRGKDDDRLRCENPYKTYTFPRLHSELHRATLNGNENKTYTGTFQHDPYTILKWDLLSPKHRLSLKRIWLPGKCMAFASTSLTRPVHV